MQVVVKKKVLEQLMKQLAEDRSYRSRNIDQIAGDDRPVMPDAQMATQLSAERIPVEDPDFLPVNTNQLSTAASQIAKGVSPKSVQKFYRGLKKLIQKTSEPNQYKGMSETDLMEALRPIVIREARNPNKPSYLSSGFRDETEDDDTGEKPDTGFRADVPSVTKEPGKKSPGQRKTPEQKKREKIAKKNAVKSTPIVKIAGEKLSSEAIDELESMREKWTMAPSMIAASQLKRLAKIKLSDLTIGDASRILDVFLKSKEKLPKTFEESGLKISFESVMARPDGFDYPLTVIRILITDPAGREEIVSGLKNISPIIHTGGPIETTEVLPDGTESPGIYYLLEGYPFSEQQYMDSLRSSFVEAYNDFQKKLIAQLTRRQEKEQKRLDAAASKALEKKKPATIQKSLSVDLAKRDAVAMPEEDPEEFEKILSKLKPALTVSDYENLSYDEQSEVLSKVAQILDAQRGPYYDVGEMDYLRDIISDESDYTYMGDEEEVITTSPVAAGVETLAETFFETAIEPVASYVIETVVENNPDIGKELDYIMDMYGFVNFQDFIGNVENKKLFNDVITEISKKFLKSDPAAFENVIPDFERLKTVAIYKKDLDKAKNKEEREKIELANQIYTEFEGRMRLLGVEDVGRLRAMFQHMKSPVSFMKAVDIATRLEAMEGKSETAEAVSNPELLRNLVASFIKRKVNADPAGFAITYEKLLTRKGIKGYEGLVKADIEKVIDALEEPFSEMIKKQQGARNPGKTPQVDAEVKEAIDNFCTVMGSFFETMNDASSPEARPILIYLKKFIADLTKGAGDPEMQEITPIVLSTIEEILNPGKKPKKKK